MISVIVPIYKVEAYLRRCVDSVLAQSYENFELILVDDGSPDCCPQLCDAYVAQDPRVRVIHKANGGLSDARNAGLRIARGAYIAFVDSDDWLAPDFLEKLRNGLLAGGGDICECQILRTSEEVSVCTSSGSCAPETYDTFRAMRLLIEDKILHQHVWNKLYRRETIGEILFPKGKTNEDEFWTYQIFGRAKRVCKIQDVLYFYYQRPGSIMNEGYSVKRLDVLEAKCLRQRYIEQNFPELALKAKRNLYSSAMYAGQMSLLYLRGQSFSQAKQAITKIADQYALSLRECVRVDGSSKVWFILSKCSFWETCRLRNILKKGF